MTSKERDELLIRIDERLHQMKDDVEEIKGETRKTNGRVTSLETSRSEAKASARTIAVIAGLLGGVVGAIIGLFKQ